MEFLYQIMEHYLSTTGILKEVFLELTFQEKYSQSVGGQNSLLLNPKKQGASWRNQY